MRLTNFNLSGVGLDISDLTFKMVQLTRGGKHNYQLNSWGSLKIKPGIVEHGMIVDHDQVVENINKLKSNLNGTLSSPFVVLSLPETKTFLKVFTIPKLEKTPDAKNSEIEMLKAGIEEALPKEIPLSLDKIVYDFEIISQTKNDWQVLVGVAPSDVVLEYTQVVKAADLKPIALEIEAQAIVRSLLPPRTRKRMKKDSHKLNIKIPFLSKSKPESSEKPIDQAVIPPSLVSSSKTRRPLVLVDLGATRSSIIVHFEGFIYLTRSVQLSGQQMTDQIALEMKLTQAKAEQAKIVCGLDPKKCKGKIAPIFNTWTQSLIQEIQSTITFFKESNPRAPEFEKIILCGGGAALLGLDARLRESIKIPVEVCNPTSHSFRLEKGVQPIPPKSLPGFTTAIGLAMRNA